MNKRLNELNKEHRIILVFFGKPDIGDDKFGIWECVAQLFKQSQTNTAIPIFLHRYGNSKVGDGDMEILIISHNQIIPATTILELREIYATMEPPDPIITPDE